MPPEVVSQANVQLASGIPFISDAELETALGAGGVDEPTTQAVVEVNEQARLDGLRAALALLAFFGVIALFFTRRIPLRQPGSAEVHGPPAVASRRVRPASPPADPRRDRLGSER